MYLDIATRADVNDVLHHENVIKRVTENPTFVVIKAAWCSHCVKLQDPLDELVSSLRGSKLNIIVLEYDAFKSITESQNPVVTDLRNLGKANNGVPYIGISVPGRTIEDYDGPRTAVGMAKFVLDSVTRRGAR